MIYYFQIGKWGKRRITMKTTRYASPLGGIDKKLRLLELEQADTSRLFVPKKSRSF